MKRVLGLWIWFAAVMPGWAGTVPNQITYQGTIKEQGVPVTGTRTMLFRLTNSDGSTEYWKKGPVDIDVSQGLFSTVLSLTGVPWQDITPYIELSVGPQGQTPKLMLPREPITATAYAFTSGQVVDASIVPASVAPGYGLVPSGTVVSFAGSSAPAGWLLCDGNPYGRTDPRYANLFAAISTTWGAGDGSTTFNVPDLRGKAPVGAGQGVGLTFRVAGSTSGEEQHVLTVAEMPSHSHTNHDVGHTHPVPAPSIQGIAGGGPFPDTTNNGVFLDSQLGFANIQIDPNGGDKAHNNMQPSAFINFIIKT